MTCKQYAVRANQLFDIGQVTNENGNAIQLSTEEETTRQLRFKSGETSQVSFGEETNRPMPWQSEDSTYILV